jgi:serine protease Do
MSYRIIIALLIAASSSTYAQQSNELARLNESIEQLVSKVGPSVVQILVSGYAPQSGIVRSTGDLLSQQRSTGSGVILGSDGYIVTNAHVIDGAKRVQIVMPTPQNVSSSRRSILKPGGHILGAQIINIDRETDLAVLKVQERNLPTLEIADSDEIRQGQLAFAFGSPMGLKNSVTMGVVSNIARQLQNESPMIYIQTDAPINPGNSGGPLVNTDGKLIGINTLIFSQSGGSDGIGFAAPSNIVESVYRQIRETGRVHRGDIGIYAQTVTPLLSQALGLSVGFGAILGDVHPDGAAHKAGLQTGDIVLSVAGKPMENGRQLSVNLYRQPIGERVLMSVLRGTDTLEVSVEILNREDATEQFADLVNPDHNLIPELGILALDLDHRISGMFPNLRIDSGVVVAARALDAPFWEEGFLPGDIIHQMNGQTTDSLSSLRSQLATLKAYDPVVFQIERDGRLFYFSLEYAQ